MDKPHSDVTDPIDRLLAAGLTTRDLLPFFLENMEWLGRHLDDSFRLCYHDTDGQVVVEKVDGLGLMRRSKELGWRPSDDRPSCEDGDNGEYLFYEPVYHCRRGVHWYATAIDETTYMLPLGLPASVLEAAAKRDEAKFGAAAMARRKAKNDRETAKAHDAKERSEIAELHAAVDLAASDIHKAALDAGKPITVRTARKKAWKHIKKCDDWTYHRLVKIVRANAAELKRSSQGE